MQGGSSTPRQPFSEHIKELRQRLIYSLLALLIGSGIGYALHDRLFQILRQPLDAKLYYTSPVGGFNSMLKLSMLVGLVLAIPVVLYQISQFLKPLFKRPVKSFKVIFCSVVLASTGVAFAYFISLPAAVHFLTHVDTANLQPFIVVNDYLNFVFSYLAGFAVLFQLPLILLLINRIKPQRPKQLMHYQRYVILSSFIVAAILTPTPDPANQAIMAGPLILLYQFSIALVWVANRKPVRRAKKARAARSQQASAPSAVEAPSLPRAIGPLATNRVVPAPGLRPSPQPRLIVDVFS